MSPDAKKELCISGIVTGSMIGIGAPMVGVVFTILGMKRAFDTLSASGVGDPTKLSAAIGDVLHSTFLGLAASIPGFIILIVSAVSYFRLPKEPPPA